MKKALLRIFLFGLLLFGLYGAYKYYGHSKEEQRRAAYYENIVDTSSPTVTVLRDSILIGYQNKKRTIHIYVPPNYDSDSVVRYPVMYFLDGESSFNDLENMGPEWQIDEVINAASANGQQTAIVVGINQAEDRDAEYTPFVNDDNPKAHGAEFAKWLTTDLKNWIDANYRTKREAPATSIGGISRSGMMAYYMLMAHPEVFGNAIIQSPSMWVDHDRLMAMNLSKTQLRDKKIFVSVGAYEGQVMIPHAEAIYNKFKDQGLNEDELRFEIIPDEGHWHVTWRKSFALSYPWLME
ncbi:MAG: putative alpha/beta superfamily hydrolase [Saprospiraceae bacterium]|jgi:predicted alpha/beta superfamily hydrolase